MSHSMPIIGVKLNAVPRSGKGVGVCGLSSSESIGGDDEGNGESAHCGIPVGTSSDTLSLEFFRGDAGANDVEVKDDEIRSNDGALEAAASWSPAEGTLEAGGIDLSGLGTGRAVGPGPGPPAEASEFVSPILAFL